MKTVTFDETTHAIVPKKLTDNMIQVYNQSVANWEGFIPAIEKAIAAAPPYKSVEVSDMVWIPCSKRLPEKRARCLCLTEDGDIEVRKFCLHKFAGARTRQVTYWMELPSAPKGE
jgi:hypothetical protein